MNTAAQPTEVKDVQGDHRWQSLHKHFMSEASEKEPEVIFIGDSLVAQLAQTEVWHRWFAPMHALNFGIDGDQCQNVLWRVENGELDNINPKAIVLLVGTSNYDNTPEEIVEGINVIVKAIHEKQPNAWLLLLTLLPRGKVPNPLREKFEKINSMLEETPKVVSKCHLVKVDSGFIHSDGTISHYDMYDYLHLTKQGYEKAFEPVYELLTHLIYD